MKSWLCDVWRTELLNAKRLSYDIEIADAHTLTCVAFAASAERAYVFPATRLAEIREILESPVPKVAQNGAFDAHFLLTRYDLRVHNYADDTIVAWHACYPELAGAAASTRGSGSKRTRKSLAFLASLFTFDAWWKRYDTDERGMYELCGRDACITFDIMAQLDKEIDRLGVRSIYEHQMRLIWPCVEMQARGIRVDDEQRKRSLDALSARHEEVGAFLLPLSRQQFAEFDGALKRRHLFWKRKCCDCCRGGKAKSAECWSCAGFDKKPTKSKLGATVLQPCEACGGKGKWETFDFNPASPDQTKVLLYDVLKLPKRYKDGKLTADEESLKATLGTLKGG